MLRQEDIDFCTDHRKGLNTVTEDDIASVFNRFIISFQLYHRLFDRLPDALTALGRPIPKNDDQNNTRATTYVTKYLGGANILSNLTNKKLDDDIDFLRMVLDTHAFHITFNAKNEYREDKDKQLAQEIKSANPAIKAKAILCVVYQIRCNIEHSRKHMEQDQCYLVSAVTRITQAVTDQLYDKLAAQQ
jgi:hypothetical protein